MSLPSEKFNAFNDNKEKMEIKVIRTDTSSILSEGYFTWTYTRQQLLNLFGIENIMDYIIVGVVSKNRQGYQYIPNKVSYDQVYPNAYLEGADGSLKITVYNPDGGSTVMWAEVVLMKINRWED